jgi:hypothetical protein
LEFSVKSGAKCGMSYSAIGLVSSIQPDWSNVRDYHDCRLKENDALKQLRKDIEEINKKRQEAKKNEMPMVQQ